MKLWYNIRKINFYKARYSYEEVVKLAKEYLESEIGKINWLKEK